MSELTSYYYYEDRVITPATHQYRVYRADEADKVIAELQAMLEERNKQVGELKKERDWLAKDRAQAYNDLEKRAQLNIKQEESIRHHKYKRCLDNAERCRLEQERIELIENQDITDDDFDKLVKGFYKKWRKRWLELAKKFKEVE